MDDYIGQYREHRITEITDNDYFLEDTIRDVGDPFEDIEESEMDFQIEDKKHLKYYIGIYEKNKDGLLIMTTTITIQTFGNFDYELVDMYLKYYFVTNNTPVNIDIMQLYISNDLTYYVVLKTFWLRIVQRTWRRIFNQRCAIIQIRKKVSTQEYFRTNGKYPQCASRLPTYLGCIKSNSSHA